MLNDTALQIVLVADEQRKLIGTLSDGDIRRGLIKGFGLTKEIGLIMHRDPLVVPSSMSRDLVLQLMSLNNIHQIPVVNHQNVIEGLHLWDEMSSPIARSNTFVIMAGGKGTRLRPHTEFCPKPMIIVGGKPILEHIIGRAKVEGFSNFVISVNYLAQVIVNYFGSGDSFDVSIQYIKEDTPLGTAGALSLFSSRPIESIIVTNGDVLTDVRYGDLLDFHARNQSTATMAVRSHEWQHPYGVVRLSGLNILGFEEKPIIKSYVNAGIYALSPEALDKLGKSEPCDMPSLFDRLKVSGLRTMAYPMHEPWLDVGYPVDIQTAETALDDSKSRDRTT